MTTEATPLWGSSEMRTDISPPPLSRRLNDYTKQKEGLDAFAAAGISYEPSHGDEWYDNWLKQTVNKFTDEMMKGDEENFNAAIQELPYDSKENRQIASIYRFLIGRNEFIVYAERIYRYDDLGNRKSHYRSRLGRYPKPIIERRRTTDPKTGKTVLVTEYVGVEPAYSIPFTESGEGDRAQPSKGGQKSLDDLYKFAVEGASNPNLNTQYYVLKGEPVEGNHPAPVRSFKDFRNGIFEELFRFDHIANADERQRLDDEKSGKYFPPPSGTGPGGNRPYS